MLKDQIFKASIPKLEPVELSDGLTVYVRSLSGGELGRINYLRDKLTAENKDTTEVGVWAIMWGVCDQDGKQVFTVEDYDQVAALPWTHFNTLIMAVTKASGLNAEALDEAKKG